MDEKILTRNNFSPSVKFSSVRNELSVFVLKFKAKSCNSLEGRRGARFQRCGSLRAAVTEQSKAKGAFHISSNPTNALFFKLKNSTYCRRDRNQAYLSRKQRAQGTSSFQRAYSFVKVSFLLGSGGEECWI